ncbi:conjugative transposon protein TraM [Mucilaginibacter celer]|uniref:Conjugative transposon protein TraM n=1 Tax=Mucilaginibacter celer TaxID=2305508 RepID=A0A494VVP2_9SPHI|nr:conjugative transposon protein TraM [Mucilaginibacter celer]AYL95325.1 conjugative transposon protein TraM [Mucilaginibacter celer]
MKINFKQPKYVLPAILLPFLCFFFYIWQSNSSSSEKVVKESAGFNGTVGNVSADISRKQLSDKLDAYRNAYKEANGITAVGVIPKENSSDPAFNNNTADRSKQRLDSIQLALKKTYPLPDKTARPGNDQVMARAIESMGRKQSGVPASHPVREQDPMEIFRQQMAIMDSISRQNDPDYKDEMKKKQAGEAIKRRKEEQVWLPVSKADSLSDDFNTVLPEKPPALISAIIDENLTGYAGSRIRIRLLEDIRAGNNLVVKGTYLYALISGFSEQRVTLSITSILYHGKILPVKLDIYDMDGMPGLYVPSSAFRDFTKDLGGNTVQGFSIDGSTGNNQFLMSSVSKMFQSTSSAIAELIRKNKAKLKYNSYLFIVDPDALHTAQKNEEILSGRKMPQQL